MTEWTVMPPTQSYLPESIASEVNRICRKLWISNPARPGGWSDYCYGISCSNMVSNNRQEVFNALVSVATQDCDDLDALADSLLCYRHKGHRDWLLEVWDARATGRVTTSKPAFRGRYQRSVAREVPYVSPPTQPSPEQAQSDWQQLQEKFKILTEQALLAKQVFQENLKNKISEGVPQPVFSQELSSSIIPIVEQKSQELVTPGQPTKSTAISYGEISDTSGSTAAIAHDAKAKSEQIASSPPRREAAPPLSSVPRFGGKEPSPSKDNKAKIKQISSGQRTCPDDTKQSEGMAGRTAEGQCGPEPSSTQTLAAQPTSYQNSRQIRYDDIKIGSPSATTCRSGNKEDTSVTGIDVGLPRTSSNDCTVASARNPPIETEDVVAEEKGCCQELHVQESQQICEPTPEQARADVKANHRPSGPLVDSLPAAAKFTSFACYEHTWVDRFAKMFVLGTFGAVMLHGIRSARVK